MAFQPESLLVEAVENKELRDIRSYLTSYMVNDPANKRGEIIPAIKFVEENDVTDLWQSHDGREFKSEDVWDEEYFGLLQAQLMNNFSKERFRHALEVGKKVYGPRIVEQHQPVASTETSTSTDATSDMGKYLLIGLGAIAIITVTVLLLNRD